MLRKLGVTHLQLNLAGRGGEEGAAAAADDPSDDGNDDVEGGGVVTTDQMTRQMTRPRGTGSTAVKVASLMQVPFTTVPCAPPLFTLYVSDC